MKQWFSRHPYVTDGLIALLLISLGLLEVRVNRQALPDFGQVPLWVDALSITLTCTPLIWRRRYPLTAMVLVVALAVASQFAGVYSGSGASVPMFLAVYSAGAYSHHRRRDVTRGLLIGAVMAVIVVRVVIMSPTVGPSSPSPGAIAFTLLLNIAFFTAAWILGDSTRHKDIAQHRLEGQTKVLERQREELAESAVASERLRIARELHDVVGHHVSVMGVQAAAARRLLDGDPDKAQEILTGVESSGRDAVDEMGRLVALLRSSAADATPGPQPGLSDLDAMIERMSEAGLDVSISRVGRPGELGAAAELSLYRVVQESLTNALRHADGAQANVKLAGLVDGVEVEINSPLGANHVGNGGPGRGVIGMRERVLLHGGEFTAGPEGGRYRVSAHIPYRDRS